MKYNVCRVVWGFLLLLLAVLSPVVVIYPQVPSSGIQRSRVDCLQTDCTDA
jgi:hypothetical protein